jgi:SNF2 family DNA or RNA helicase
MSLLRDRKWKLKYTPDHGDLVDLLYVPALECAVRYDRLTGYFNARALALAARGIEGLVRNSGRVRLLVGCTLEKAEVDAITHGAELRDQVKSHLLRYPLKPGNQREVEALELLAWMVAQQILEVKVAVPCDERRRPLPSEGLFHEKSGIIEDKTGDRLAFNGSLNETAAGWTRNWESLNIFCSWRNEDALERVVEEDINFRRLWDGESPHVVTLEVPEAARADLLRFLPTNDEPARLKASREDLVPPVAINLVPDVQPPPALPEPEVSDSRRAVWSYIQHAAKLPNGGERVGEATANVTPWPHQVRAFDRLYKHWPPRLLIADEVGLGKTIQAGLLLRQAWLAEKANRILILAPANVCRQWQVELREKFNLNWPLYDGEKLIWMPTPARPTGLEREVSRSEWHKESVVIASSHLMRRAERQPELLEQTQPWDLVIVDEAHHARRRAPGATGENRPNSLLRLLRGLDQRTQGLVLLTATPMQVHPVEVWDLLSLLRMPAEWSENAFLRFTQAVEEAAPSHEALEMMSALFQASERAFGPITEEEVKRLGVSSGLAARKILKALRDPSTILRRQLETHHREIALKIIRAWSPVGRLISRHTRDLLRRYYATGKLSTPIATRDVDDRFIPLSPAEGELYRRVETYIAEVYNRAAAKEKNAVGFIMTIYRRRLASSFAALAGTLENRLASMRGANGLVAGQWEEDAEQQEWEVGGDVVSADEAAQLDREALAQEERTTIEKMLADIRRLPPDTKAEKLAEELRSLRAAGYPQTMVFTQYTDTMDFLRVRLAREPDLRIMCFSGRGGEVRENDGTWRTVTREAAKRHFREGKADVLLCTDAAAEGINFQFCGSLVNYDMPWNPMRVEQRIGRIDRLGQKHPVIRIVNLHYSDTVEADVYLALRKRISLFTSVVGRLQPILARMPGIIAQTVLSGKGASKDGRNQVVGDLEQVAAQAEAGGFDLDEFVDAELAEPPRPEPALSLADLEKIAARPDLLPGGVTTKPLGAGEFSYIAPGQTGAVRVTTRSDYFDDHGDSMELWSMGAPCFPTAPIMATTTAISRAEFAALLGGS